MTVPWPWRVFPRVPQRGEGGGLAGAGGSDEQVEAAAGGGDRGDRGSLIGAELGR